MNGLMKGGSYKRKLDNNGAKDRISTQVFIKSRRVYI